MVDKVLWWFLTFLSVPGIGAAPSAVNQAALSHCSCIDGSPVSLHGCSSTAFPNLPGLQPVGLRNVRAVGCSSCPCSSLKGKPQRKMQGCEAQQGCWGARTIEMCSEPAWICSIPCFPGWAFIVPQCAPHLQQLSAHMKLCV